MFEDFKKFTMMEETNSVATDSTGNNAFLAACAVLEHRPNLQNKKRQGYNKRKERLERLPPHNGYHYGFEDGYRYAIERLQRHSS